MDQEKASHVNALTLCFRDSDKERQYQEDPDIGKEIDYTIILMLAPPSSLHYNELYRLKTLSISGFPASLACSLILTLLLGGLQVGPQSAE